MPKKSTWKPGEPYPLKLNLAPDLAIDLHAFAQWHYGGNMNEIGRRAIAQLIEREVARSNETKREFDEIRRNIAGKPPLTVVPERPAKTRKARTK